MRTYFQIKSIFFLFSFVLKNIKRICEVLVAAYSRSVGDIIVVQMTEWVDPYTVLHSKLYRVEIDFKTFSHGSLRSGVVQ